MSLTVEIKDLDAFIDDVKKAGGDARPLVKAALTNSSQKIQSNVRERAPHRTGTLQRSVLNRVDYPSAMVTVQEKYGEYVEKGTGIYAGRGRITPKRASVLAWKGPGGMVFARSTKGMKARPFFKPGIEASAIYVQEQFKRVTEILVKELKGR